MAKNQDIRIQADVLAADQKAFQFLKTIGDYQPLNPAYTIEALDASYEALRAALEAERQAQEALAAARKVAVAAGWDFHNNMLGVKRQVVARYGQDSDQVVLLGLKKKSERKAPVRKRKPAAGAPETGQQ